MADVVVATHVRNRPNISRSGLGRAKVEYIDNEYIASKMYNLSLLLRGGSSVAWTTGVAMAYPSYLAFEYEVRKRFETALRNGEFDIVHRVTPMSPTTPSPVAGWSPVPFVLGPLNGGLAWPRQFRAELRREREWLTYARGAYKLLPYYRSTYAKSAAILAAFQHTVADLPHSACDRIINFPEVGVDTSLFQARNVRDVGRGVTFLFVGRLVPYKCPDVIVRAFGSSELLRDHRLVVIGDGPERADLERMVREYRLERSVELLGNMTQSQVADAMRRSDVFVFPSIRELGAGVVVEAMASGLPCIVVDYGGPAGLVPDRAGIRIPIGSKQDLVKHFAQAMEMLARSSEARRSMGETAAAEAAQYTWQAKAERIIRIYEWVLGRSPKPSASN